MKRDKGAIDLTFGIVLITFVMVIILFTLRIKIVSAAKIQVEDALADACLASVVIDVDEFGRNHNIVNRDYDDMYKKFCASLKPGLNLDEFFTPMSDAYLASPVKIEEFWIYNVERDNADRATKWDVKYYYTNGSYNGGKEEHTTDNPVGSPLTLPDTPNGKAVTSLTVYAKISFDVMGMPGHNVHVFKEQTVDTVLQNYH